MKFDADRAKESAIDTGAAVAGAVAGLAVSNKVAALITEKSPASNMGRHVPALLLGGVILSQAFGLVPSTPLVDSALQGVAVVAGMQAVREYSGANDPLNQDKKEGLVAIVNQYVPGFAHEGSISSAVQKALDPTGVNGLGWVDYSDPAQAMLLAGREQQAMQPLRSLGSAPVAASGRLQDLG